MSKIGIFFGTDTGTTRLIAKKMFNKIGSELASKPLNVNRVDPGDIEKYDALILGTPSYGVDQLPGISTGIKAGSWEEFLPKLNNIDFSSKRIALYGLGNQEKYAERFADSMIHLYTFFIERGAEIVGLWDPDGYNFIHSQSIVDKKFVGLVLDQQTQPLLTEQRIEEWLGVVTSLLLLNNTESKPRSDCAHVIESGLPTNP